MIFSSSQHLQLKSKLRRKYRSRWNKTLKQMKALKNSSLAQWVQEQEDILSEYSAVNWFYVTQLESFLFFHAQKLDPRPSEDFSPVEELVFDRWNASELADIFLKAVNKKGSVALASQEALKHYEQHLLTLGKRHLLKEDKIKGFYRPHTSLGEKKVGAKVLRLLETTINLDGKSLVLKTSSLKEMKKHSQRIEEALKIIQKSSPDSWQRFTAFTEVIVPIREERFVSYSHQELPGVSMINLYHRDFVDLMDDLLHENGHHHLNAYLNLTTLIDEPLEQIYYSPCVEPYDLCAVSIMPISHFSGLSSYLPIL